MVNKSYLAAKLIYDRWIERVDIRSDSSYILTYKFSHRSLDDIFWRMAENYADRILERDICMRGFLNARATKLINSGKVSLAREAVSRPHLFLLIKLFHKRRDQFLRTVIRGDRFIFQNCDNSTFNNFHIAFNVKQ